MLCQNCGKNEANVRYTESINGVKKELHLCTKCSEELGIGINHMDFNMPINLSSFLGDFLQETETNFLHEMVSPKTLMCDECHMTYDEFVNTGKFGCGNCYEVFSNNIDPLLKNIHVANRHVGRKIQIDKNKQNKDITNNKANEQNVGAGPVSAQVGEIEMLKNKLKIAIQEERYEDAAKIRDEIKKLEK